MTLLAAAGLPFPSIGTMLAIGAFLAVFVAGLFARSILEHELEIWHRSHPQSRPPRGGHRAATKIADPQMRWPVRDDETIRKELAVLNAELETLVA